MGEVRKITVKCDLPGESYEDWWLERKEQIGIPIYAELSRLGVKFFSQEEALDRICQIFAEYVYDWNLTDDTGKPLPKPHDNPDAFKKLAEVNTDGFLWISRIIQAPIESLFEPKEEKS